MAEETTRRASIYGGRAEPFGMLLFEPWEDWAKRKVIPRCTTWRKAIRWESGTPSSDLRVRL